MVILNSFYTRKAIITIHLMTRARDKYRMLHSFGNINTRTQVSHPSTIKKRNALRMRGLMAKWLDISVIYCYLISTIYLQCWTSFNIYKYPIKFVISNHFHSNIIKCINWQLVYTMYGKFKLVSISLKYCLYITISIGAMDPDGAWWKSVLLLSVSRWSCNTVAGWWDILQANRSTSVPPIQLLISPTDGPAECDTLPRHLSVWRATHKPNSRDPHICHDWRIII